MAGTARRGHVLHGRRIDAPGRDVQPDGGFRRYCCLGLLGRGGQGLEEADHPHIVVRHGKHTVELGAGVDRRRRNRLPALRRGPMLDEGRVDSVRDGLTDGPDRALWRCFGRPEGGSVHHPGTVERPSGPVPMEAEGGITADEEPDSPNVGRTERSQRDQDGGARDLGNVDRYAGPFPSVPMDGGRAGAAAAARPDVIGRDLADAVEGSVGAGPGDLPRLAVPAVDDHLAVTVAACGPGTVSGFGVDSEQVAPARRGHALPGTVAGDQAVVQHGRGRGRRGGRGRRHRGPDDLWSRLAAGAGRNQRHDGSTRRCLPAGEEFHGATVRFRWKVKPRSSWEANSYPRPDRVGANDSRSLVLARQI